jgi:hypothetical protein
MADQKKDKQMQIDEMLDSLLANYSSAEPRPGLENRILANLILANPRDAEGREASRGWWGFKWLWTGAMLAAAIIVGAMLISGRRHVAPPSNTVAQTVQPAVQQPTVQQPVIQQPVVPPPLVQSRLPAGTGLERVIHRHKTLEPGSQQNVTLAWSQRPPVFPTPTPLSEQERLMFTYLENTPREVVVAQIPRNDDQKEAEEFWADREPSSGTRRSTTNR